MENTQLTGSIQVSNFGKNEQSIEPISDRLPNGRFAPGHSGNAQGKPLGSVSIRNALRKYLDDNPLEKEEFVKHFARNNRELAWQMLEGRPAQAHLIATPSDTGGEAPDIIKELAFKLNALHGGTDSGGNGALPSSMGS